MIKICRLSLFTAILATILLTSLFSCKKKVDYDAIVRGNLQTHIKAPLELLNKLSLDDPAAITFADSNLYYLVAVLYYEAVGYDESFASLIKSALESEDENNLFHTEALKLYIMALIKEGRFEELKRVVTLYAETLPADYKELLLNYAGGKGRGDLQQIPGNLDLLPLLAEPFAAELGSDLLRGYLVSTYNEQRLQESKNELKKLALHAKSDYLQALYYHISGDSELFTSLLKGALLELKGLKELDLLHKAAVKGGKRVELYNLLKKEQETKELYKYYYAIESVYFLGNKRALEIVKDTLPLYDRVCLENYHLRSKVLYLEKSFSENWIKGVISFNNDYPGYYHSRMLLNSLLRTTLANNKSAFLKPYLKELKEERMDELNRSIYYYVMYLADGRGKEWSDRLTAGHPLSYGALRLVRGELGDIPQTPPVDYLKGEPSEENRAVVRKVDYLLEFGLDGLIKDLGVYKIENKGDKAIIYYRIARYLNENRRYKEGIAYYTRLAYLLYGESLEGIDLVTLQGLFPTHYLPIIERYSARYGVDPALAFAVMREESYFQESVQSWAGAIGLMQIMPATADWLRPKVGIEKIDLTNPEHNIHLGVYFLDFLTRYFSEPELIMAGYNAGQGNALKWQRHYKGHSPEVMYELIPVDETRHYIRKVTRSYYVYKYILGRGGVVSQGQ